jgi:hypothetical protein
LFISSTMNLKNEIMLYFTNITGWFLPTIG